MESTLSVCVFCASSDHVSPVYHEAAEALGDEMARRRMTLVYGGGNNGLMGMLAGRVHAGGGRVVGVIPRGLRDLGYAYDDVDEMIVTRDLRERKGIMESRAEGFVCLAGGFGTLEEILEIITLRQLGMLDKPVVLVNTRNYFRCLMDQFAYMCEERFCSPGYRDLYHVAGSPRDALDHIESHAGGTPSGYRP